MIMAALSASDLKSGVSGLEAALAMLRTALAADAAVAIVRRGALAVPIAAAGTGLPAAAFRADRLPWRTTRADGIVELPTSQLPSPVLPMLDKAAAQAALLLTEEPEGPIGGVLLLWAQPGMLKALEPVAGALRCHLATLIQEADAAADWQRMRIRFEDLLASIPAGLVFTDARSEDCLVNAAAADLLGCQPGVIAPAELSRLMHGLRRRCRNASTLEKGIVVALAHPNARATEVWDLDDRLLSVESRPLLGEGQSGRVWIFEDVTAAHRARMQLEHLAADLRRAKDVAEAASQAKGTFLATMSHEIRTPLNAVLGFTDLLLETALTDEQRTFVEMQDEAGRSLLAIINDVLDFSKIEAGRLVIDPHPLDLRQLLQGCLGMVQTAAGSKGLDLHLHKDPAVPDALIADGLRLRQILLNLLSNAVKFTSAGSVRLTVRGAPAEDGLWHLRFAVEDTGIGIAQDQQGKLFEPFTQADASTTRHFGGTGLGLAICRRLVMAMGGEIGVSPREGGGTCFWFVLPLAPARPSDIADAGTLASPAVLRPGRVLVVDDLHANRILVSAMLRKVGQIVDVAENGDQAVTAVANGGYDLVLMDIQMPMMDGLEAARHIRALPGPESRVPILALTAAALPDDRARCREAGMNGHVAKPIDQRDLMSKVAPWLGQEPPAEGDGDLLVRGHVADPAIDPGVLADIEQSLGRETVEAILAAARPILQDELGQIAVPQPMDALASTAHRLVNTAGNLGFTGLASLARDLDVAARSGDQARITLLIPQVRAEGTRVGRWLDARFPAPGTSSSKAG